MKDCVYDLLDGINIPAKCIINQWHTKVHLGVNVKLISIFRCCREVFSCLQPQLYFEY